MLKSLRVTLSLAGVIVFAVGCATTGARETRIVAEQHAEVFQATVSQPVRLEYLLSLPTGYDDDKSKKWPLVLFLHGMGERGTNIAEVAVHGPPKLVKEGKAFPFILISPQCPAGDFWHADQLIALLDKAKRDHRVDEDRVYVTGLSMGGYGTWDLATEYPDYFAAAAPICGGGDPIAIAAADPVKARSLKALPIWAFHGAKDNVVPLTESESMVKRFKSRGNEAKLTIYPEANHDSWTETYNNPELYTWLLQHDRKSNQSKVAAAAR